MKTRTLFLATALVAVVLAGVAFTQGYSPGTGLQNIPANAPPSAGYGVTSAPVAPAVSWEASIEQQPIDQLLDSLDGLHAQKAELERREKVLTSVLKKKVEKQKERLMKAGVLGSQIPSMQPAGVIDGPTLPGIPGGSRD